jgi:glycosyltransferase involved in cell wall biosynthesis
MVTDPRPLVLCIVDRPGWAHDRKTQALAAALAAKYRLVTRYQSEVSAADIRGADLVLVYYWMQIDRLSWRLRRVVKGVRERLMIGVCGDVELQRAWRKPGLAMLSTLPAAVFANNLKLAKELESLLAREVFYTPNGVDTSFFRPAAVPPPPAPLRAGWTGSLKNHPGHRGVDEFIVPAVAAVDGAELCLAAREDRWRDAEEMREFYQSLHVYVCASRSEGTPNPCLEAAACGLAVLTTPVGNMPELIRDGENGLFVSRDVDDIAAKLRRLRDDPELRERMGLAARAAVEAWDWRYQAPRYAGMFDAVLASRESCS